MATKGLYRKETDDMNCHWKDEQDTNILWKKNTKNQKHKATHTPHYQHVYMQPTDSTSRAYARFPRINSEDKTGA